MSQLTEDLNILATDPMPSPDEIKRTLPASAQVEQTVLAGRRAVEEILDRRNPRLFMIVGPCSIHDPLAGMDYARRLTALADKVSDTLLLVMRVYFEKPRTSTGW